MKQFFRLVAGIFCAVIMASVSRGAGVTVITHGYESVFQGYPLWVDSMAQAITNAAGQKGLKTAWYHLQIGGNTFTGLTGNLTNRSATAASDAEEIVLTVDWSALADHTVDSLAGQNATSSDIAPWIAAALLTKNQAGFSMANYPIHLIGHSRGGSVMLETAKILGSYGIWVDHVTTLDPHPLGITDPGVIFGNTRFDATPILYENVVFADNYWRTDFYPLVPAGQAITGAEDHQLDDSKFPVPTISDTPHSDVHSWYHGTIYGDGGYPANDGPNGVGGANIPDSWYSSPNPARNLGGFFFTRIENNFMHYRPVYSSAIGQAFGGRAQRAVSSRAGGTQWANIGQIHIPADPNNKFTQGDNLTVTYKYQDRDSGVLIEWYIDTDANPFNNSSAPIFTQTLDATGDKVVNGSATISTAGLTTGYYRGLFAKIISLNNNTVRYDYSDNEFIVYPPGLTLISVTPSQIATGAGATPITLIGKSFTPNCMLRLNNGLTTIEIAPTSITSTQILANYNFGSTARTWDVLVRDYISILNNEGQTQLLPNGDTASVQVNVSATDAGPTITSQPGDATIAYGQTNTFSVTANGSGTLTYQWQRNGQPIAGATDNSYTTSPVTTANDGFTYQVLVSDANGSTASRIATLNVVSQIAGCNDPMEPNDHSYQATTLPLGVVTNGLICSPSDVDWFKVTLVTNGLLNLSLVVPSGLDFDLELYGTDLTWVAGSYKAAGQNESIQQTLPTGDYYVRVYGYPAGNGSYSQTQPYQLSANAAEVRPPGPLSGYITNNVSWSGVVQVTGDITIATGGSLKIMPGTQIRCSGGDDRSSGTDNNRIEIILNGGKFDATGSADAPIRFTSSAQNPQPGNWYGIRIIEGDVTMSNCVVEYAVDGIRFEKSDTRFNNYMLGNVTVQRCSGNGVWTTSGQYAAVTLNNFQLWTNSTGLQSDGGPVTLMGGQVTGNTGNGINMNGALTATGATISQNAGVGISGGSVALTSCAVSQNGSTGISVNNGSLTSCLVTGNHGDGVYANGGLQMNGCSLSRNNGWGLNEAAYNNGSVPVEVWNNLVQSNGSGGLNLYYHAMVGVVNNTISGNSGNGMNLSLYSDNWGSGGVSASGITGNAIYNNGGVGVEVQGSQPPVLTVSGNDIYQNTSFEFRNDSGISIVAPANYWGEPTTSEWTLGLVNLTRIYDQRDNLSYGQVLIQSIRGTPALQAPHFTSQPQPVTALPGDTITLSASADGTAPISYQWYRNNSVVSQATSNVLTLANVVANNAGNYYLVAANAAGRATSLVAQVTIILPPSPPVIVQHPVSQTVGLGASVSFAVAATGTGPFTYQWNKNGAPIVGANAPTFSISSVLVSDAADYTATVSNSGGNATSQPATLTVNSLGGSVVSRQITRSGTNFLVTVTVAPPIATPAYIVEEFVPTNFTVVNVSSLGSLDAASGRIDWGIFWDGLTRTVSYMLSPPPGFVGTTTINGSALFFGATATTGGDNQITMIPQNPNTLGITQWYGYTVISISGTVGSSYRLEASTSAIAGTWQTLGTFTLPRTPYSVVDWDSPSIPNRFYRTVLIQ